MFQRCPCDRLSLVNNLSSSCCVSVLDMMQVLQCSDAGNLSIKRPTAFVPETFPGSNLSLWSNETAVQPQWIPDRSTIVERRVTETVVLKNSQSTWDQALTNLNFAQRCAHRDPPPVVGPATLQYAKCHGDCLPHHQVLRRPGRHASHHVCGCCR